MSQIGRLISVEIFQFLKNTAFTFRMDLLLDDLAHPPDSTICKFSVPISVDPIGRFVLNNNSMNVNCVFCHISFK